ncbi:helix-turn-helix transcriptional regulator [uncultured Phascolarctobacterium sp.]|uniref:helix-turn-helix transcriptional regulator n=1 Tax=uncultured Phascolarctobacterium sp. TaxID=512296 RepID=UPI0020550A92|nr:helix-turn-helix transcriptional regulator [uncultured Phascolarctobacterium sp.]DAG55961.1 MAG TPA: Repressor protein CI [Bacteriophage sp.]
MGISENIKILRERYGLSQKELGQIAGVSDKAVSTWEQGLKEPRMGAIQKLADYFSIRKSDIIEDGGLMSKRTPSPSLSLTQQEETHIKKYRQLDADGRERVDYVLDMEYKLANERAEKEEESLG